MYFEKPEEPEDDKLYFQAEEDNSSVKLTKQESPEPIELVYSEDGTNWIDYEIDQVIALPNIGDKVYLRAKTQNETFSESALNSYKFIMTGKISAHGNIQYLLDHTGERIDVSVRAFIVLFEGCTSLTSAPELPATQLEDGCYARMFEGCTSLTSAPELPATQLVANCYLGMFFLCTSLKLSKTQTEEYRTPYRIPKEGEGVTALSALDSMFSYTGGTFKSTPEINKTYYGAWD